jgi:hypothetical protein
MEDEQENYKTEEYMAISIEIRIKNCIVTYLLLGQRCSFLAHPLYKSSIVEASARNV